MEAWRQYKAFQPPATHPQDVERTNEAANQATYVAFEPADPANPQNWSDAYKAWVIVQLSILTLSLTFASAASSSAEKGMMEEFGCGEVAAVASTGVFLMGMGIGAMPFAPLSECKLRLTSGRAAVPLVEMGCT